MNTSDLGCDQNSSDDATQSPSSSPDQVDARPTEDKSAEVDAIPIVRPQGGGSREPLVIPTHKDSPHYILEGGVKQVIIFNQKKFAQRLGLGTTQI